MFDWTTDHWRQTQTSACFFRRKHWDELLGEQRPQSQPLRLRDLDHAFERGSRLPRGVCDRLRNRRRDTLGQRFRGQLLARHERLKILTLNLHCYQEENQSDKFTRIAKAINDLSADIVCLQEVGELWNGGSGDWDSNAARIIKDQLVQPYHYQGDWSHLGFHKYREGSAILSKYPFSFRTRDTSLPFRTSTTSIPAKS